MIKNKHFSLELVVVDDNDLEKKSEDSFQTATQYFQTDFPVTP